MYKHLHYIGVIPHFYVPNRVQLTHYIHFVGLKAWACFILLQLTPPPLSSQDFPLEQSADSIGVSMLYSKVRQCDAAFQIDSCIIYNQLALNLSRKINYTKGIADALVYFGKIYYSQYQYQRAIDSVEKGIATSKSIDYWIGIANGYFFKSYALSALGDYGASTESMLLALETYNQIGSIPKVGECYTGLGYLYGRSGLNLKSLTAYSQALESFRASGDTSLMADGWNNLGNGFFVSGAYQKATECYFEALALWSTLNDSSHMAQAYGNIGGVFLTQKDYNKAIEYLYIQKNLLEEHSNKNLYELAKVYENLGKSYDRASKHTGAQLFYKNAASLFKLINYEPGLADTYTHMASMFLEENKFDSATYYAHKAIQHSTSTDSQLDIARNQVLLARIALANKAPDKSLILLKKALEIAKKSQNPELEKETSLLSSNAYIQLKNYKLALQNRDRYYELSDSLVSISNIKKITQLELQYNFEQERDSLMRANIQDRIVYHESIKRQKLIKNGVAILCILLIIFSYFIFRNYQQKRNDDKEKEALLKEIHHRVKNNLQVISSLLNLQTDYLHDLKIVNAVNESQSRVKAMALIHQLLYQEEKFSRIDFEKYLDKLTQAVAAIFYSPGQYIETRLLTESIALDIDTSIPLGLMVNELVSNAYKYAFKEQQNGCVTIQLQKKAKHQVELMVRDNGCGLPDGFEPDECESMGFKLVRMLTDQIDGSYSIDGKNGTTITISFNIN